MTEKLARHRPGGQRRLRIPTEGKRSFPKDTVKDLFAQNKPVAFGRSYYDTIELFSRRRPPIALKNGLRTAGVARTWDKKVFVRETFMGWRLIVNGPSIGAIRVLDQFFEAGVSISAVHIAYEFDVREDVDRDAFVELLNDYTTQRYQRVIDEPFRFKGTHYSVDTKIRQLNGMRRPSKIIVMYHDKPGKLDGELEKPRIEIRFEKPAGVKAAGIKRPIDLLEIRLDEIFTKSVMIRDYAERSIRVTLMTYVPTPFFNIDLDRRVRTTFRKIGICPLSQYRKRYPRRFKKLRDRRELIEIDKTLHYVKKRK